MTLMTRHVKETGNVEIRYTYGPAEFSLQEQPGHARQFHTSLGRLLDGIEGRDDDGKTHGQRAYEAYHASAGGKSVHGEPLTAWEDQHEAIREHWEQAAAAVRT